MPILCILCWWLHNVRRVVSPITNYILLSTERKIILYTHQLNCLSGTSNAKCWLKSVSGGWKRFRRFEVEDGIRNNFFLQNLNSLRKKEIFNVCDCDSSSSLSILFSSTSSWRYYLNMRSIVINYCASYGVAVVRSWSGTRRKTDSKQETKVSFTSFLGDFRGKEKAVCYFFL